MLGFLILLGGVGAKNQPGDVRSKRKTAQPTSGGTPTGPRQAKTIAARTVFKFRGRPLLLTSRLLWCLLISAIHGWL